jgi:hypothetical protein
MSGDRRYTYPLHFYVREVAEVTLLKHMLKGNEVSPTEIIKSHEEDNKVS